MSTVSVTFKIQNQDKGLQQLSADAEGLKKVLGATAVEVTGLKKEVVSFAAATVMFDKMGSALSSLQGIASDLAGAWAIQEQAETQLSTVMQQRMGASQQEIQSIKDLASAQQQLGVIGDEVQLAGAQQVSTFLENKSSIDVLLPAMNDLLAQQKGLNATSADAVNIGNLVGKAMQGQTGALRRCGIVFNEAQEQVLKFGTEEERAATLAEVITQNVGHMNSALAKTDSGKVKQVENALGDLKEQAGQLAAKILPWFNKGLELSQGIASIGEAVTSMKALKGAIMAAIVSSKALKIALLGLGIGAVAVAVGTLVSALTKCGDAEKSLSEIRTSAAAKIGEEKSKIELLVAAGKDETLSIEKRKSAIDRINEIIPGYNARLDETTGKYQASKQKLDEYISSLTRLYELEGAKEKLKDIGQRKAAINSDLLGAKKKKEESENLDLAGLPKGANPGLAALSNLGAQMKLGNDVSSLESALADILAEEKQILDAYGAELKGDAAKSPSPVTEATTPPTSPQPIAARPATVQPVVEKQPYENGYAVRLDSLQALNEALQYYTSLRDTQGMEEARQTTAEIARLEKKRQHLLDLANLNQTAEPIIGMEGLSDEQIKIQFDAVGLDKIEETLKKLREMMADGLLPDEYTQTVRTASGAVDRYRKSIERTDNAQRKLTSGDISEGIGKIAEALRGVGAALSDQIGQWVQYVGNIAQAAAAAIPAIAALVSAHKAKANAEMEDAAAGAASSQAAIPFVGPALAVAAVASVIASLMALPKFAKGGIAYGPTVGMFGEYAGAANNPEVVAPLDRLRELIKPEGGLTGRVVFDIDGYKLRGVLQKVNSKSARL